MNNIELAIMELEKYAELERSEWGETVIALIGLWYARTLLSDKMTKALEKEIHEWLKNAKDNATIVEETVTPEPYTVKSLEWDI